MLAESATAALEDKKVQKQASTFTLELVRNKSIKEGVLENYLYSPVRSFFSLGYAQAEEERLAQEKKSTAKYKEVYDDYYERAQEPGFREK